MQYQRRQTHPGQQIKQPATGLGQRVAEKGTATAFGIHGVYLFAGKYLLRLSGSNIEKAAKLKQSLD